MRRHLIVATVATAVALAGCAPATTSGGSGAPASVVTPDASSSARPASGRTSESREVRGFTGVQLAAFGTLQIEQTGTESLTIEADDDVLPSLTSEVTNGVLRLGLAPNTTIDDARPVVYRLTVAALDTIAVSGAGDVTATGLRADRLTLDVSGAGDVTLDGTVDAQVVTIGGTGDYDGEGLQSATATITVDGAADVVVRVSDRLDATVGGAGSVEYIGNPQVTQDVRGIGSVERR